MVVAAGNDTDQADALGVAGDTHNDDLDGQVLAVGGVDRDQQVIFSTPEDADGDQARFLSAPAAHIQAADAEDVRSWTALSGTSMAAPQAAGGAALVREKWEHLKADEVIDVLLNSAADGEDVSGMAGSYDDQYGHGILDLHAALQADPASSGTTALTSGTIDGADDGARLEATWLQLPPAAGDALSASDELAAVTVADPLKRTTKVDLRPVAQATPTLAPEQRVGQLLAARKCRREPVSGGERLAYRQGGHQARGFSAASGLGYAVSELVGTYPEPFPAVQAIGPRAPLLGSHERLTYADPQERGWMSSAWVPLAERWHIQAEGFHRVIRPDRPHAPRLAPQKPMHALGARTGLQYSGDTVAARLDIEHAQRPDAWGMEGSGALATGSGDTEQAIHAAAEYRWREHTVVHGRTSVRHLQLEASSGGLVQEVGDLVTAAARTGVELRYGSYRGGLILALPERIEQGKARLRIPSRVTPDRRVMFEEASASLSPSGRTRELEAYWNARWQGGTVFVNGVLQREPGHQQDAPAAWAVALGGAYPF